jgi:hypothetical protein
MSHTLTETATYDATVTVPDDGDARTAASVNTAFQSLADRSKYLLGALNGFVLDAVPVSSVDGATLVVGPIAALQLGGALLSTSINTNFAPGGLVANSYYFLYAYNNAGALGLEASTTGPDASGCFKSGDTSRRYLCSFHTYSASAGIRPFNKLRGEYIWRTSAWTADSVNVLNTGTLQSTFANVNCDDFVPPLARTMLLRVRILGGQGTDSAQVILQPANDAGSIFSAVGVYSELLPVPVGIFGLSPMHRGFGYKLTSLVGSPTLVIDVAGYRE